jgi:hypothetical protein
MSTLWGSCEYFYVRPVRVQGFSSGDTSTCMSTVPISPFYSRRTHDCTCQSWLNSLLKNSIHYYIETLPSRTCTYTSVRNNIFAHVLRTDVLGLRAGFAIIWGRPLRGPLMRVRTYTGWIYVSSYGTFGRSLRRAPGCSRCFSSLRTCDKCMYAHTPSFQYNVCIVFFIMWYFWVPWLPPHNLFPMLHERCLW